MNSKTENSQLILLIPVIILIVSNFSHRLSIQEFTVISDLTQSILGGLAEIAPLLLAIAIVSSYSKRQYDMQPLNCALYYFVVAGLFKTLSPFGWSTGYISAAISASSVIFFTPYTRQVRLPIWLKSFQGDAIVLMLNAAMGIVIALPMIALLHGFQHIISLYTSENTRLWIEPLFYLLGTSFSKILPVQTNWHSLLSSHHAWFLMLSISWILQHAMHRLEITQTQRWLINLLLCCLTILTNHIQPVLLLLLLWAPWHGVFSLVVLGAINFICHLLQLEQSTYQYVPELGFAIPASLFGLFGYELRHQLIHWLIQHCEQAIHFFATDAHFEQKPISSPHDDLLLDMDYLTISYLKALGGLDNLQSIRADMTRLIIDVETIADIDKQRLREIGVMSINIISTQRAELMTGPIALTLDSRLKILAKRQSLDLTPKENHILSPYRFES